MKRTMAWAGASILVTLAGVAGCDDPADDTEQAVVTDPSAANQAATAEDTPAAGAEANLEKLSFNQETSTVAFVGSKVTGSHDGGFKVFSGTIELDTKAPENSKIKVEIDTQSVFTDTEKLTKHLKSPDFFDVASHPKAVFTSTKIEKATDGKATHRVTGELDLHGVKKVVTFPATIKVDGQNVAANAEFSINRKDFNINYPGVPDDLIRDQVVIKLELKAQRQTS